MIFSEFVRISKGGKSFFWLSIRNFRSYNTWCWIVITVILKVGEFTCENPILMAKYENEVKFSKHLAVRSLDFL